MSSHNDYDSLKSLHPSSFLFGGGKGRKDLVPPFKVIVASSGKGDGGRIQQTGGSNLIPISSVSTTAMLPSR